nr:MAG TPA: cell division protein [Caudoviricetes sp.]
MHGAWYWHACHASHHHHMNIMMFIIIMFMMIIDHHDVRCSLFVDQSMNNNSCSLIIVVRWLCERERVRG